MTGRKGQGRSVARPYGFWIRVKGPRGPIRTEHWYENRSDRDRGLDVIKRQHKQNKTYLDSGKLQK